MRSRSRDQLKASLRDLPPLTYWGKITSYTISGCFREQNIQMSRETYTLKDFVGILPIDLGRERVLLVRQPRAAAIVRGEGLEGVFEIPGGRVSSQMSRLETAIAELYEECGVITSPEDLTEMPSLMCHPASVDERVFLFSCQTELSEATLSQIEMHRSSNRDEPTAGISLTFTEFKELIANGTIIDAKTIAAFTMFKIRNNIIW